MNASNAIKFLRQMSDEDRKNLLEEFKEAPVETAEQIKNHFCKWIQHESPIMKDILSDIYNDTPEQPDTNIRLLLGEVQMGKTSCMTAYMLSNIVLRKRANVIVVMNNNSQAEQFQHSCLDLFQRYSTEVGLDLNYKLVLAGGHLKSTQEKIKNIFKNNNGVILCLGNGSQIRNVLEQINELQEADNNICFDLFVDEADDYFDKPETTIYSVELEKLKLISRKKICVTATAMSLVFSDKELRNKLTWIVRN